MKINKTKVILLFISIILTFTACGPKSSESKIISSAKEIVGKDLSDDISINECLFNEESNAIYIKFTSDKHGDDEAIILFDDNSVFYESIYSTIKEDDYEKIIEYGDYTVMKYQIESNDENWVEMDF